MCGKGSHAGTDRSIALSSLCANNSKVQILISCHATAAQLGDPVQILTSPSLLQVIAHSVRRPHSDVHRFEKISNIVKQFKLSCSKLQAQFQSMEVRNSCFAAFIDVFTPNTYIMVIMSDSDIRE